MCDAEPVAVIDLGSGSARAAIARMSDGGAAEILTQQRVNLNLMSQLNDGALSPQGVASAIDALEDFAKIAGGYGVKTIHAVGTAALRESRNYSEIAEESEHRWGVRLRIITGMEEAGYCFLGAVHGLPVADGMVADLGGGSLELAGFSNRVMQSRQSLPLGSLRIANDFSLTNRVMPDDLEAAARHIKETLSSCEEAVMAAGGTLIGSGGSLRLMARMDRIRRSHPIHRIHGHEISRGALSEMLAVMSALDGPGRATVRGMSSQRVHSIVGGILVTLSLVEHLGARGVMLSGNGLREGLARHPEPISGGERLSLPTVEFVRSDTLRDLSQRFAPRYSRRGARRAKLARKLAAQAWNGGSAMLVDTLSASSFLLDIGNAIDYYNRFNRTASIIAAADMPGFSHRESAQMIVMLLMGEKPTMPRRFGRSRLLTDDDKSRLPQAAAMLVVADELERLAPPLMSVDEICVSIAGNCKRIATPVWSRGATERVASRWREAFQAPILISQREK